MAQEPIDYELVLADLQSKRDSIDTALTAIRAVLSAGAHVSVAAGASAIGRAIDPASIPDDAFFGLSIVEGVKKLLGMVKRKQTVKELADALDKGGLPHSSTNFVATVATMMNRANDPELARVGRGEWGLASWYGNRRPKMESPKRRKRQKRTPARKVKTEATKPNSTTTKPKPEAPKPRPKEAAPAVKPLYRLLQRLR